MLNTISENLEGKEKHDVRKPVKKASFKQPISRKSFKASPYHAFSYMLNNKSASVIKSYSNKHPGDNPSLDEACINKKYLKNLGLIEDTRKSTEKSGIGLAKINSANYCHRKSPNLLRKIRESSSFTNKCLDTIETQLSSMDSSENAQLLMEYFKIFDNIILKDKCFGGALKRIRDGIWTIINTAKFASELQLEQESFQQKIDVLVNKPHCLSTNIEIPIEKEKNEHLMYKFVPFDNWTKVLSENTDLLSRLKDTESQLKDFREKEKKYGGLIGALKNRGYPVDEVYKTDVQWFMQDDDQSIHLLKKSQSLTRKEFVLSSSSSSELNS